MKLKGLHFADVAEIQEAVTNELRKVQKEEFSAAFQKMYESVNAYIYIYIYIYKLLDRTVYISYLTFTENKTFYSNLRPALFQVTTQGVVNSYRSFGTTYQVPSFSCFWILGP
jgi:hypothetical protein